MSKKEFIEELYRKRSNFNDPDQAEMMSNLLETVSSDIYSESQRFVFELIQNADDSAKEINNEVHFEFLPNCLIVSHNGSPFSESDIKALTSAGSSTKKADPTKTGYKGIGFKSVFGKSQKVTIFSDGYQFRFDKSFHQTKLPWQIIPIWTEADDLPKDILNSLTTNKFQVSTAIEIRKAEILQTDLDELLNNGQILLFLRRISKVSVSKNGRMEYSIEKKIGSQNSSFNEVTLLKSGKEISSWIVKTFEKISISSATKSELKLDDKTPEKLKDADYTEISFAAKIEEAKIKSLKEEESLVFTYLPTKFNGFKFPFLVNGSFLTNAAREGLHEDRIWNQWLMKLIAQKIIEWIEMLSTSKFNFQILHLLPDRFNNSQNELKISFDTSLVIAIKEKAFVPSKSLSLKKVSDLIVDKTGLSDLIFISPDTVTEFINQKEKVNFKNDSFIHSKLQRTDKLRSLGAKFFDVDNLEEFFISPIFKDKHKSSENFSLIEYFYGKASKEESKEWNERLKGIPFIYAKGKKLKSPQSVCFPSVTFETEFGDGVTLIHSEVYPKIENNSKVKNWLEKLGVKEPSDIAYLENEIIGNIENCITKDNYLRVTRYLFNQHKKALLTDLHYNQLQVFKLFTTTKELISANQCFLSDVYEPSLKLQEVNNICKFVSEIYKQTGDLASEWKTFFLKIGTVENVELKEVRYLTANAKTHYKNFLPFFDKYSSQQYNSFSGGVYQNTISTYSLTIYSLIEFSTTYEFSKLFWDKVIKTKFVRANNDKGFATWQNKTDLNENLFNWCIDNAEIFPSTLENCMKASELFINDKDIVDIAGKHLPVFDCQEPLPDDWRKLLPFKQKLELGDYLSLLEKISDQTKEDEILRKYNKRKIRLIYNKLTTLLPNFSGSKKTIISDWASTNKLLSVNGKFENATELKWIKIDGFTTESDKLKILYLPENSDTASKDFEDLISLFQVQIIDKFIPAFGTTSPEKDFSLKSKLLSFLVYLVAVIEKKNFEDFNQEFTRLEDLILNTEFFNAIEIKLTFNHQSEIIEGPSLNVYKELNKFYFKGKWTSPLTMFGLIPELTVLLSITGVTDELRLFLQLTDEEIMEWMIGQGFDFSRPEFKRKLKRIKQQSLSNDLVIVAEPETTYSEEFEDKQASIPETFIPISTPKEFDATQIQVITKIYTTSNQITQSSYSEIASQEVREDVGIWSEEFVYEFLLKSRSFSNVVWENKDGETGKPYDFKVTENGKDKFIDVKGTPSDVKDIVYLSSNEWIFMFDKGEDYSIYRVYNAGKPNRRIEIIENPSNKLMQGKIFPNPITLQI